jgi:hypothetical protein
MFSPAGHVDEKGGETRTAGGARQLIVRESNVISGGMKWYEHQYEVPSG